MVVRGGGGGRSGGGSAGAAAHACSMWPSAARFGLGNQGFNGFYNAPPATSEKNPALA